MIRYGSLSSPTSTIPRPATLPQSPRLAAVLPAHVAVRNELVGLVIRSLRLRRRQIHNGEPWTLDDLAVAMGTNKGYLSRVERGQITPSRNTLIHLAKALELTPGETAYLLRLAGHAPMYEPPDMATAQQHIRYLFPLSAAYPHPLLMQSRDLRVWYVNALFLRVMDLTPQMFRRCMQGQYFHEIWRCVTWRIVRERTQSPEPKQRRMVLRLRTAALDGNIPLEHLLQVQADPCWHQYWENSALPWPEHSLSLSEMRCQVTHPIVGLLTFDVWWSTLETDPRFEIAHYLPHDAQTQAALAALRRLPRPRENLPCAVHPLSERDSGPAQPRATPSGRSSPHHDVPGAGTPPPLPLAAADP
jgi:transcriptional regulator with XRE-family HTH domain